MMSSTMRTMPSMDLLQETIEKIELLLLEMPSTPERRDWLARLGYLRSALLNAQLDGSRASAVLELGCALLRLLEEVEEREDDDAVRDVLRMGHSTSAA